MIKRLLGVGLTSVVTAVLALIAVSIVARRLGPTGTGEYQSVIRWTSIWMVLGMLGFAQASSYFASRVKDEHIRTLVGNAIRTTLAQSAFVVVAGYFIAPYVWRSSATVLSARIFLIYVPLNLVTTCLALIALGRLDTRVFNTFRLIQGAGFAGIVATLILIKPSSAAPLAATVVAACFALAYLLLVFRERSQLGIGWGAPLWKSTAKYALLASPGLVGRELSLFVDQLLISLLLPTHFLGLYAAGVSAASVIGIASAAVFYLAQPEVQNSAPGTAAETSAIMSRLTVAVLLPMAIILTILMPLAVPIVYGPAFAAAVGPAQILCFAAATDGVVAAVAGGALGTGRPLLGTVAQVGAVAVEVTLVLVLLPRIGLAGAAVASLIAYGTSGAFLVMTLSRALRIPPRRFVIPTSRDLRLIIGLPARVQLARRRHQFRNNDTSEATDPNE